MLHVKMKFHHAIKTYIGILKTFFHIDMSSMIRKELK